MGASRIKQTTSWIVYGGHSNSFPAENQQMATQGSCSKPNGNTHLRVFLSARVYLPEVLSKLIGECPPHAATQSRSSLFFPPADFRRGAVCLPKSGKFRRARLVCSAVLLVFADSGEETSITCGLQTLTGGLRNERTEAPARRSVLFLAVLTPLKSPQTQTRKTKLDQTKNINKRVHLCGLKH